MTNPYDQNYFGDNYYSFENNQNNGFQNFNRNPRQMRPKFDHKSNANYGHQNHNYGNKSVGPVSDANNYYRRTQHPYMGRKGGPSGGQYRAQVIDYSSGPQTQYSNKSMSNRFQNNGQQFSQNNLNPMTNNSTHMSANVTETGLLPTPHPYPNIRAFGQPSHRSLLPIPEQRFGSHPPPPQQPINCFMPTNQSYNQNYCQSLPPQPVPPPTHPSTQTRLSPLPVPPVAKQTPNQNQHMIKVEPNIGQQKEEESRVKTLISEGMQNTIQNDLKGFYCLFCEVFCNNLNTAERHVESPKHQRTKIGDYLKGIDAKFTIKSERIRETSVALARKEELNKISNVIKNEYFNEGIRLKDGFGSEAYVCENCGVTLDSLSSVKNHLETHKQFAEQLKICSKPVVGLDLIVEYIDPDPSKERVYECVMCRTFYSTREIISHVCSFTHRTNFIRKIHPSEGHKYTSESQQLSLEAGKRALELETLIGRGQFKVKHISAPANCSSNSLTNILSNYSDIRRTPTPKEVKPLFPIEIPKQKSEQEKTDLEKLCYVRLSTESDANDVTNIIQELTNSVMEYHMKGMSPQMREQFKKHLKDSENISFK